MALKYLGSSDQGRSEIRARSRKWNSPREWESEVNTRKGSQPNTRRRVSFDVVEHPNGTNRTII